MTGTKYAGIVQLISFGTKNSSSGAGLVQRIIRIRRVWAARATKTGIGLIRSLNPPHRWPRRHRIIKYFRFSWYQLVGVIVVVCTRCQSKYSFIHVGILRYSLSPTTRVWLLCQ